MAGRRHDRDVKKDVKGEGHMVRWLLGANSSQTRRGSACRFGCLVFLIFVQAYSVV